MTKTKFPPVPEQMTRILRGVVDVVSDDELRRRLKDSAKTGRPLRVKLGIDPSSPDIHIGHTVVLRKLRVFQELGHHIVVIWGTATAMVGDPTGRDKTRPQLDADAVEHNLTTYKEQIGKILDVESIEHTDNGDWFSKMTFMDSVKLFSRMTVARAIERDNFEKRMKAGLPVSLHEVVYPLMQGWDSVEVRADVELGGTDQLFNLLVGRDLQVQEGQRPQVCLTTPLIEGLDGSQKMSKSLGNAIGVNDEPSDMFGKVMSVPDELMGKYFSLLTEVPEDEIASLLEGHPRHAKARLGREIVTWLHGEEAAQKAADDFDRVFRDKGVPDDIPEFAIPEDALRGGTVLVSAAAHQAGLSGSANEARRLMSQGGVRIDGEQIKDSKATLSSGRYLLQVGKRKFCYVTVP